MRRLLPLALLLVACAKSPEGAPVVAGSPSAKVATVDLTPEGMAKAMDVPLYPGAEAPDGLSSAPQVRDDGSTHYSLVLATKDDPTKALAWYAKETGFEAKGSLIIGQTKSGHDVVITAGPEAGRTLIRIKSIVYANK